MLQALEEITFNFIQHQNCIAARRVMEAPKCSQRKEGDSCSINEKLIKLLQGWGLGASQSHSYQGLCYQ